MKEPISRERWEEAQIGEKLYHIQEPVEMSYEHYRNTYKNYFEYLGIDKDLKGKKIMEIGPGRISGLLFCENYSKSYIIEPTEYEDIDYLYEGKNLEIIKKTVEETDLPEVDEVWIFNLLQHVQNPDLLVSKCKEVSKIIRFFEPIDLPTNLEHPFTFSKNDFITYFGSCVTDYEPSGIPGFHGARCVYGIYSNP